jgi:GNAT superfamily N-acetyltransferase
MNSMNAIPNIQLRIARSDDFQAIEGLSLSHLSEEQRKIYYQRARGDAERFRKEVLGELGVCFIACSGSEVVGYVVGAPIDTSLSDIKYAELENIFVCPEYRRSGIGKMLCDAFLGWAREHGFERVAVKTGWKKQEELILFYMRSGFTPATVELELKLK